MSGRVAHIRPKIWVAGWRVAHFPKQESGCPRSGVPTDRSSSVGVEVRGPHGQVFVRGVEVRGLGPGPEGQPAPPQVAGSAENNPPLAHTGRDKPLIEL
jgi:hypothetical protein